MLCRQIQKILPDCEILSAENGVEAIQLIGDEMERLKSIDLILTDVCMDGGIGLSWGMLDLASGSCSNLQM